MNKESTHGNTLFLNSCFISGILVTQEEYATGLILKLHQEAIPALIPESVYDVVISPNIKEDVLKLLLNPGDRLFIQECQVYSILDGDKVRFKVKDINQIQIVSRKLDLGTEDPKEKFI